MHTAKNDLFDDCEFELVLDSERKVEESFEVISRTLDSFNALRTFVDIYQPAMDQVSFESAAKPLIAAITAGTDFDLDSVDYSVESLKDIISDGFKSILEMIKTFFKHMIEFLDNIDITSTWMLRRTALLERVAITSRGKRPSTSKVELGRIYRFLRVGRIYADDSMKLEHELKRLHNAVDVIGKEYLDEMVNSCNSLGSAINGKTGAELDQAVTQHVLKIPLDSIASKLRMTGVSYERFNRSNVMATPALIGGRSIYYLKGELINKGSKAFRTHGFIYEETVPETFQIESTREFHTLGPVDIGSIPNVIKDILIGISKSANAERRGRVKRAQQSIDSVLKSMSGKESVTETDMETVRRTVTAMVFWLHSVSKPLFSNSLSVCRATLNYCEESAKTFK